MTKKNIFEPPYIGIEKKDGITVYYNRRGDYSVTFQCENPIIQYSADIDSYYDFHALFSNIIKILGAGYTLQKQDIFSKKKFVPESDGKDYLTQRYFEHFNGRVYTDITTYITITGELDRSKFLSWNDKNFNNFIRNVEKVVSLIRSKGITVEILNKEKINEYIYRFLSVNFNNKVYSLKNIKAREENLRIGNNIVQSISLVDIDEVNFPSVIKPYKDKNIGIGLPVDILSFLHETPGIETVIYNQVISIPDQRIEAAKLEAKTKRKLQ